MFEEAATIAIKNYGLIGLYTLVAAILVVLLFSYLMRTLAKKDDLIRQITEKCTAEIKNLSEKFYASVQETTNAFHQAVLANQALVHSMENLTKAVERTGNENREDHTRIIDLHIKSNSMK